MMIPIEHFCFFACLHRLSWSCIIRIEPHCYTSTGAPSPRMRNLLRRSFREFTIAHQPPATSHQFFVSFCIVDFSSAFVFCSPSRPSRCLICSGMLRPPPLPPTGVCIIIMIAIMLFFGERNSSSGNRWHRWLVMPHTRGVSTEQSHRSNPIQWLQQDKHSRRLGAHCWCTC